MPVPGQSCLMLPVAEAKGFIRPVKRNIKPGEGKKETRAKEFDKTFTSCLCLGKEW